jgi:hypothetical protein
MKILPCPPFEELIHPTSSDRARDNFKKDYDVSPECFIIEVAVHGAPRGDAR